METTKTIEREQIIWPWNFEPDFNNRWRQYTPEECGLKNGVRYR